MKKILFTIILLSSLTFADITWYGYYESEGDYGKTPKMEVFFDYNKFRLDFDTNPAENIHIGGDLVYKMYGGKTSMNITRFIDKSFLVGLPQQYLDQMNFEFTDSLFFDNLYLDFHHKYFEMTIGRQQIPTGVGYAWNPTDIFNKKDIMDPTYENRGIDAIQLNVPIGSKLTMRGIIQPENSFDKSKQYIEAKTWLSFADVSLIYARTQLNNFNDIKDVYGINMEGDILGFGVRTEFTANRMNYDNDNLQYKYILGADFTFENSLYILGEYLHNDFGAKENETELADYMAYFQWQQISLNQNYLFLMAMYPITDLLDGSLSGICNFDDQSFVVNPQLVYRIYENVELTLMGNIFIGGNTDEFGYQEIGGRIRLRAYF